MGILDYVIQFLCYQMVMDSEIGKDPWLQVVISVSFPYICSVLSFVSLVHWIVIDFGGVFLSH